MVMLSSMPSSPFWRSEGSILKVSLPLLRKAFHLERPTASFRMLQLAASPSSLTILMLLLWYF